MATLPSMDVCQQVASLLRVDAALVNTACTALVELVVDDGVGFGSPLNLSCFDLARRKLALDEEVEEWLCPSGGRLDGEDACYVRVRGFRVLFGLVD